jgi:hypothetical protein
VLFLQEVNVAEGEMEFTIDLRPFMNPSPYTVQHVSTAESFYVSLTVHLSITSDSDQFNEPSGAQVEKELRSYSTCVPEGYLPRVTIPDNVLIQPDLLRMSKILIETCTCRGSQ